LRVAAVLEGGDAVAAGARLALEPGGNTLIVCGRVREGAGRQPLALLKRRPRRQRRDDGSIVGWLHHNAHTRVVLGRGAHHRGPADVDVLHAFVVRCALGHGRAERVQVDHDKVDGRAADLLELLIVFKAGKLAHEDAAVHARMQGLDAAVHDLGRVCELGHVLDWQPCLADGLGGAASGQHLDAVLRERSCELDEPRLVGYGEQRAAH